tara:strand:- start:714 stop:1007 length:294 start_codon:yes stop_codon:yes gene_type:complete
MHQIIFSPEVVPNFLGSKVIDIEDKNILSLNWHDIFTILNGKYNIPKDKIVIKKNTGTYVDYKNINLSEKFPFDKYCYYDLQGNPQKSYLIKFDFKS